MSSESVKGRFIVAVINDISTDQRVERSCRLLVEMGYDIILLGRLLPDSQVLPTLPYRTRRFKMIFRRGPLFYLFFNLRVFLFILLHRAQYLFANDVDTLLAIGLSARIKGLPYVFDSHELFTEVPELAGKGMKRWLWGKVESWFAPKANALITVNDSIAAILSEKFRKEVYVVRNTPPRFVVEEELTREELDLPSDKRILILQGSGINIDRGAEEAVSMMQYLEGFYLIIAGGGDVIPRLKGMAQKMGLDERVLFLPRQPYRLLMSYTKLADAGLTLDKDTNLNYRFSLPNKLFDYIQAGIPVFATDLVEVKNIIEGYGLGVIMQSLDPIVMAQQIKESFEDTAKMQSFSLALRTAAAELCWEVEKEQLRTALINCLLMNSKKIA